MTPQTQAPLLAAPSLSLAALVDRLGVISAAPIWHSSSAA